MRPVRRRFLAILPWLVLVGTSGCTRDFRVRRVDPAPLPPSTQQCVETLRQAKTNPAGQTAHREAAGRLLTLYGTALLAARDHTVRVPGESGPTFTLTLRRGSGPGGADPSDYETLEPADGFVVDHADHFSRTPGEGVPVAARQRPMRPVSLSIPVSVQPVAGFTRALTVVARVDPRAASAVDLALYDPRTVSRGLAADYTTPLALNLAHFRPQRRGLRGLLRGEDYFASTGLYALETPTPDKTPLVLVHGLISDPGDFYRLENDLAGSEEVRRRYQVWVFYYPSSLPVVYSAMLLRESVDGFIHQLDPGGTHPVLHRAVLVGHSMGGLLSRIAVSEGGDRYYRHFFRKPVDQLQLSADDRALVRRGLYSPGSVNVARVIFISTPHHGSRLASGPLGGFGRMLLNMPSTVSGQLHNLLARNQHALADSGRLQPGSSLDSLTPDGTVIAAVNDLPIRPGVRLHSIIGDRGRGGPPEGSSDGVVPYASSHLPEAESECIVPAGHTGTLLRPETSAEVIRILGQ